MNMLIGILCEVVSNVANVEAEQMELNKLSGSLATVLAEIDEDYDGLISKTEVMNMLNHPHAVKALQAANVDVFALVDNADVIFDLQGREALAFSEFLDVLQQFRGTTFAAVRMLNEIRGYLHVQFGEVRVMLERVDSRGA